MLPEGVYEIELATELWDPSHEIPGEVGGESGVSKSSWLECTLVSESKMKYIINEIKTVLRI